MREMDRRYTVRKRGFIWGENGGLEQAFAVWDSLYQRFLDGETTKEQALTQCRCLNEAYLACRR